MAQKVAADVEPLLKTMNDSIRTSSSSSIAVAYLRNSGFSKIRSALVTSLENGGTVRMLIGTGFALTDYRALASLLKLMSRYPRLICNVFEATPDQSRESFHPKLYLFTCGKKLTAIVGSSNLSSSALTRNIEANVLVKGTASPFSRKLAGMFERWWMLRNSRPLTKGYLSVYRKYKRRSDSFQKSAKADKTIRESRKRLGREKPIPFRRLSKSWSPPDRINSPSTFRLMTSRIPRKWTSWTHGSRQQYRIGRSLGESGARWKVLINTRGLIADLRQMGFVDHRTTNGNPQIRQSVLGDKLVTERKWRDVFTKGVAQLEFDGINALETVGRVLQGLQMLDGVAGAYLTRKDFRAYLVWLTSDSTKTIQSAIHLVSRCHRTNRYLSDAKLGIKRSFANDRHLMSLLTSTGIFERKNKGKIVLSAKGRAMAFG
jgi:HKD family nuclease